MIQHTKELGALLWYYKHSLTGHRVAPSLYISNTLATRTNTSNSAKLFQNYTQRTITMVKMTGLA